MDSKQEKVFSCLFFKRKVFVSIRVYYFRPTMITTGLLIIANKTL